MRNILRPNYLNPYFITLVYGNTYPLETLENLWFFDVSRGFKKRPVARYMFVVNSLTNDLITATQL